jgi:predicted PurR-regulated permease PerM
VRNLVYVNLTPRSVLLVIGVLLALLLVEHLASLLLMVLLALIVAAAMAPAVSWFEHKRGWSRLVAVSAVFGLAIALLLLLGISLAPSVSQQAHTLAANIPHYTAQLKGATAWMRTTFDRVPYLPPIDQLADMASSHASAWLESSLAVAGKVVTGALMFFIVIITAFFVLLEAPELKAGVVALMPPDRRDLVAAQVEPISLKLGAYVQGMLISMASYAAYLAIGLSILHVPLALIVALLAGLLAVIPMIGGYLGVLLAVLMAFTVSWQLAVAALVVAYIGNFIVGHFVMPFVFAKGVDVSPLLVMLALIAGGETMGIIGALIAVPVLAAVQVLVKNLYIEPMERRYALEDADNIRIGHPIPMRLVVPEE